MLARICSLLRFKPPANELVGLLMASGPTVPTDGAYGYAPGCIFQHTDGSAGTVLYVNEGDEDSADFNAIAGLTAAQEALLGATAGTASASKALIVDASKDIAGINLLTAAGLNFTPASRTATADGTGTGLIADAGMLQHVTVTAGADANAIITLPSPTPGSIVILHVGATGYELRSSAPATVAINGGTGAAAESAIGANTTVVAICASATSWKALQLGSDGTLAQVEAAA